MNATTVGASLETIKYTVGPTFQKSSSSTYASTYKFCCLSRRHKTLSLSSRNSESKVYSKNKVACLANSNQGESLTYKDAGVDIDAGSELVRRIAKMAPGIGGFGGLFPLGMVYLLCQNLLICLPFLIEVYVFLSLVRLSCPMS